MSKISELLLPPGTDVRGQVEVTTVTVYARALPTSSCPNGRC